MTSLPAGAFFHAPADVFPNVKAVGSDEDSSPAPFHRAHAPKIFLGSRCSYWALGFSLLEPSFRRWQFSMYTYSSPESSFFLFASLSFLSFVPGPISGYCCSKASPLLFFPYPFGTTSTPRPKPIPSSLRLDFGFEIAPLADFPSP